MVWIIPNLIHQVLFIFGFVTILMLFFIYVTEGILKIIRYINDKYFSDETPPI